MDLRRCSPCRTFYEMAWLSDIAFGPRAESVRCPVCGSVWGVRVRRRADLAAPVPRSAVAPDHEAVVRLAG